MCKSTLVTGRAFLCELTVVDVQCTGRASAQRTWTSRRFAKSGDRKAFSVGYSFATDWHRPSLVGGQPVQQSPSKKQHQFTSRNMYLT